MLFVLGELSYLSLEGGVLGVDPLQSPLRQVVFEVADLAEEFGDVGALDADLALGLGECLFGVEGSFSPGRLWRTAVGGGRGGTGSA
ncbi:hypothetical protein [Streptomyces sp. IBSBF 2390]|uniref:hypothetical protein n=1 Tax=Streptomyces sp. IBSBF 2390 TaxID=2903533 RepID=UPI002FDC3999